MGEAYILKHVPPMHRWNVEILGWCSSHPVVLPQSDSILAKGAASCAHLHGRRFEPRGISMVYPGCEGVRPAKSRSASHTLHSPQDAQGQILSRGKLVSLPWAQWHYIDLYRMIIRRTDSSLPCALCHSHLHLYSGSDPNPIQVSAILFTGFSRLRTRPKASARALPFWRGNIVHPLCAGIWKDTRGNPAQHQAHWFQAVCTWVMQLTPAMKPKSQAYHCGSVRNGAHREVKHKNPNPPLRNAHCFGQKHRAQN